MKKVKKFIIKKQKTINIIKKYVLFILFLSLLLIDLDLKSILILGFVFNSLTR